MADIRELIFQKNGSDKVTAGIYTDSDGIVSGIPAALKKAEETGLSVTYAVHEGEDVFAGDMLMEFSGIPSQICTAEDSLISEISKYSGVATAAIVGFLNVYNELPIANVILTKTENRTISVALLAFQGDYQTSLSLIFASIVIVIIPILIFYLLCQEKVEHGLASGAIKG